LLNSISVSQTVVHGQPVVHGGPPDVLRWSAGGFGCKSIVKISPDTKLIKIQQHMSVLKLPLLSDIQQKVGELVFSITPCPSTVI
jgi:hypothetical protein